MKTCITFSSPATYKQSCEAYKHKGNTSGHYYVDVDGSGPIKPQLIYCNMTGKTHTHTHCGSYQSGSEHHRSFSLRLCGHTEDRTWTVIQHNNTELTRVQASSEGSQHFAYFDYFSEEEQLGGIIGLSEHCEQELSYRCRKSRLLNTLGKVLGKKVLWISQLIKLIKTSVGVLLCTLSPLLLAPAALCLFFYVNNTQQTQNVFGFKWWSCLNICCPFLRGRSIPSCSDL